MKISELSDKSFLNSANAIGQSYVIVNYEDDNSDAPITHKVSLDVLGKAIAANLNLAQINNTTSEIRPIATSGQSYITDIEHTFSVGATVPDSVLQETLNGVVGSSGLVPLVFIDDTNDSLYYYAGESGIHRIDTKPVAYSSVYDYVFANDDGDLVVMHSGGVYPAMGSGASSEESQFDPRDGYEEDYVTYRYLMVDSCGDANLAFIDSDGAESIEITELLPSHTVYFDEDTNLLSVGDPSYGTLIPVPLYDEHNEWFDVWESGDLVPMAKPTIYSCQYSYVLTNADGVLHCKDGNDNIVSFQTEGAVYYNSNNSSLYTINESGDPDPINLGSATPISYNNNFDYVFASDNGMVYMANSQGNGLQAMNVNLFNAVQYDHGVFSVLGPSLTAEPFTIADKANELELWYGAYTTKPSTSSDHYDVYKPVLLKYTYDSTQQDYVSSNNYYIVSESNNAYVFTQITL